MSIDGGAMYVASRLTWNSEKTPTTSYFLMRSRGPRGDGGDAGDGEACTDVGGGGG